MTTSKKILTSLVLSSALLTGAYAANDYVNNNTHMQKLKHMKKQHSKRGHKNPIFSIVKKLDLSASQKEQIKTIFKEVRSDRKSLNDAFTKSSFDKEMFIKIMSEKRENMIKSKAETIEKVYAVLDSKQKEQFKVLLDLKTSKMSKKGMGFDKNSHGRG